MKKLLLGVATLFMAMTSYAREDVTSKYIDNPDFGARFAAWENPGSFTFNTASTFEKRNGEVWMEKWVSAGNKLGTNSGMYQTIKGLPAGTYTLVAGAKNINQNSTSTVCKGAFLYGGSETTEISEPNDYSVTFTVIDGRTDVGIRLTSCTGNWVCVDNFRLYYEGLIPENITTQMQTLINEANSLANADSDAELKEAIAEAGNAAEGTSATITAAAQRLERAILSHRIDNATGTAPKVTTHPYVATGTTIALARLTVTGTASERGFCWSTDPNPTLLDEHTTLYYSNNGNIYHIDGLTPGTVYYVRAYARTAGYKVGYGDVVKIATLPKGTVAYGYDFAADDPEVNARINSASAECVWMYNNLSNIRGFYLNVHYVYGAGAGDGTADCSYGGWMRVSQKVAYQQTGTILHETNHGVGVGTTGEWYNNGNLRAETSRGLWLGPRATQMVRFFDNNETSTLTGDGTHMWPYGINGAQEDSYNPSKKVLYYANILITHALHQDGLVCSSSVGFASPAYVFEQGDTTKYYIKSSSESCGLLSSYLSATATGALKMKEATAEEALADDNLAWYITYNPKTCLYRIQNVATGKYFTYASNAIKVAAKTAPTAAEEFMLMPARQTTTVGAYKGTAFWLIKNSATGHPALQASTSGSTTTAAYNQATNALDQQWLFMTADEMTSLDQATTSAKQTALTDLIKNVRATAATPHVARTQDADVATIDAELEAALTEAETATDATLTSLNAHIANVEAALQQFLADATPESVGQPFDLTYLINNPDFAKDATGWSTTATYNYSCCEFYEKTFDFNQTTALKLPAATYEVRAQAFQRPGSYADVYTDYVTNGNNKVNATLYAKTKSTKIKNIYDDATTTSPGTGSVAAATRVYIPNNMQSASTYFKKGLYDNSVLVTTTIPATFKMGIKATTGTGFWICFDNFRLLCHGAYTTDDVTPVTTIEANGQPTTAPVYDLSGRRINHPTRGLYIIDGKKVIINK